MNEFDNLNPITAAGTQGETYADFMEYKKAFDTVLLNTANNFVRIGYLLKYARDTDILAESGHASLVDFAKAEYGLDKTQVSRFIAINDRFSQGGYGDTLEDKYAGFGYAKLSIMLTLPEEITEELTPDMTKAEITDLKKEIEEEQKITDVEVLLEEREEVQEQLSEYGIVIRELVKSYPKLYGSLHKDMALDTPKQLMDDLAPNGKDLYTVRVAGMGKYTITFDLTAGATVINVRTMEKNSYSWDETFKNLKIWFDLAAGPASSWEKFFGTKLETPPKEDLDTKPHKTAENDAKQQKTAENDEKQQKTEENEGKTDDFMPKPVENEPKKAEKEKPSRLHKPEKPKAEKKGEGDAPKKEALNEAPAPVEEVKPVVITASKEQAEEPKAIIENASPIVGTIEVAPVQPMNMDTKRIIEVREEVNPEKYGIDTKANPDERVEATKKALLEQARVLEHFFTEGAKLMRNVQSEEGAYEEFCGKLFERLSNEMHEFTLLNRYLSDCLDESEDAFAKWMEEQKKNV